MEGSGEEWAREQECLFGAGSVTEGPQAGQHYRVPKVLTIACVQPRSPQDTREPRQALCS